MQRHCGFAGPPVSTLLSLGRASRSPALPEWLLRCGKNTLLTYRGRSAIGLFCRLERLGPGDHVLVPAYNCGSEVDPIVSTGADVELYQVDLLANIVVPDLLARINNRTRVVYVIHYFGWPQDLTHISEACHARGIRLLEDCALSLFTTSSGTRVGDTGDAAVFSFAKWWATPEGGALALADNAAVSLERPPVSATLSNVLPILKATILSMVDGSPLFPIVRRLGRQRSLEYVALPNERPNLPSRYRFDSACIEWGPTHLTERILRSIDEKNIIQKRRSNYARLSSAIRSMRGMRPLHGDAPQGVCPLLCACIVERRAQWLQLLGAKGIPAMAWAASYHDAFEWSSYPEACFLKSHALGLPVHQDLSDEHMRYIEKWIWLCSKRFAA